MPTRYWRNLPEAARISALTQTAHQRSAQMVAAKTTVPQRRIAGAPAAKPAQQTSHHGCNGHGDFYNNNEREVGEDVATTTAAMHYRTSGCQKRRAQVPHLHQNQRALGPGERRVLAPARAAQPAALRVMAPFVRKNPLQHQNLFAARMGVGLKPGVGRPAHQRGVNAVMRMQRQYGQAGHQALPPLSRAGVQGAALPCHPR